MMDERQAFNVMKSMLDSAAVAEGCLALYRYIRENKDRTVYTLAGASKTLGDRYSDREVFDCLWILSASPFHILTPRWELHDDDGLTHPVDARSISEAQQHGSIAHPETGDLIEDYHDKIFLYFSPSEVEGER